MQPLFSRRLSGTVLALALMLSLSGCHHFFHHHHHRHYADEGYGRNDTYRESHDPRSERQIRMDHNRGRAEHYRDH